MRGTFHQALDRARLLLLAAAWLFCCVFAACAERPPPVIRSLDWPQSTNTAYTWDAVGNLKTVAHLHSNTTNSCSGDAVTNPSATHTAKASDGQGHQAAGNVTVNFPASGRRFDSRA
jgi:YD repeat-containing protein